MSLASPMIHAFDNAPTPIMSENVNLVFMKAVYSLQQQYFAAVIEGSDTMHILAQMSSLRDVFFFDLRKCLHGAFATLNVVRVCDVVLLCMVF